MKKIVASVGLVALGASGVQTASAADGGEAAKPWSISATVRGFYDDNISALPSNSPFKTDSFGFEVSPSALLKWTLEQTTINLGYVYTLTYNGTRPYGETSHYDQDHVFNGNVTHVFTERYRANVSDSFVVGQEPDALRTGYTFDTFQRVPGSNIRNFGSVNFDAELTRLLEVEVGYANTFFDYADTGAAVGPPAGGGYNYVSASLAGTLNRLTHDIHLDAHLQVQPQTVAVFGYQFEQLDYTGDELIGGFVDSAGNVFSPVTSDQRNSRSHYLYVGADHAFRPDLSGNLRVGAQYIDFYNDPTISSDISPYVQLSLRYVYATESFVEGGFTYTRSATDLTGFTTVGNRAQFTTDAESAVVHVSLTQRVTPRIYGSLIAQFQDSTYNGGAYNNESDQYYLAGLNFEYRFNPHLSFNVGYNYDKLDSDIVGRSYDRNRVYMGVTAVY